MSGSTDNAQSLLRLPRYVIVVPRNAPDTHQYLSESLRGVPGIEVVLDRRTAGAETTRPLIERRTDNSSHGDAFGCRLVQVTIPRPAPLRERWTGGSGAPTVARAPGAR